MELEVEAAEASLVVISQTYYHRWRAYVDGGPVRLLRANYAFQAIEVPSGSHRVLLAYEDGAFYAGSAISGAALLVCLASWCKLGRKRLHVGVGPMPQADVSPKAKEA